MHVSSEWGKIDVDWKSMVEISEPFITADHFILGWLSDSNSYGEYVRNCSIFVVPADPQGVMKYSNAGCASPGWAVVTLVRLTIFSI